MVDQLVEAWRANQRINARLIKAISAKGMRCTLSTRGGRNVVRQFAHVHNNRIWQLQKRAPALAKGARLFETSEEPAKTVLLAALNDSTKRVETFIRQAADDARGVRTFKRGIAVHVAYFVAHESHHRGSILLTLKQCGEAVDKSTAYGIWDWDRI